MGISEKAFFSLGGSYLAPLGSSVWITGISLIAVKPEISLLTYWQLAMKRKVGNGTGKRRVLMCGFLSFESCT